MEGQMNITRMNDETSVYYRPRGYIGCARRLAVHAADVVTVCVISLVLSLFVLLALVRAAVPESHAAPSLAALWAGVWFGYVVPLKRRRRTPG
jgi:hypothetical protein